MPRISCKTVLSLFRSVLATLAVIGSLAPIPGSAEAPPRAPGPEFALVDQANRPITARDLASKPSVVHFGYTKCPAICPTTLAEVAARMRDLGPAASAVNFVFVTVDPAHDTPAVLAEYVASFDSRIIALSGPPDQIRALASGLGASFSRNDTADGDYSMDHSVAAFLVDRGWLKAGSLYMGVESSEARVMTELRRLAGQPDEARTQSAPSGASY